MGQHCITSSRVRVVRHVLATLVVRQLMMDADNDAVRLSIARISQWMNENGAPLLVSNLAPGASAEDLAHAEREFKVALPKGLRALWLLHNGQVDEHNCFIEYYDFLSIEWALAQRESVLLCMQFAR
jgi:cell wall assembly regulator SMI1